MSMYTAIDQGGAGFPGVFSNGAAVVPNDATDLQYCANAIYVGAAGDLVVNMKGVGDSLTFKAVPAGTTLFIRAARVKATGTTATQLVALW